MNNYADLVQPGGSPVAPEDQMTGIELEAAVKAGLGRLEALQLRLEADARYNAQVEAFAAELALKEAKEAERSATWQFVCVDDGTICVNDGIQHEVLYFSAGEAEKLFEQLKKALNK